MQATGLITLLTDFGQKDGYVASMKGVILGIARHAQLIDITHDIAPQAIAEASYLLQATYRYLPTGTVHLAVVDPGVGSNRRPVAIETPTATFVGPDNGLFGLVVEEARAEFGDQVTIVELTEPRYWRSEVSSTFHGRDIFAPVAAHLVSGVPITSLGRRLDTIVSSVLKLPQIESPGNIRGEIIHVDWFGNCVTNVKAEHLEAAGLSDQIVVDIAGQHLNGLYRTYSLGPVGVPMVLIGSSGHVELAVANGDASRWLGVTRGDRIRVRAAGSLPELNAMRE